MNELNKHALKVKRKVILGKTGYGKMTRTFGESEFQLQLVPYYVKQLDLIVDKQGKRFVLLIALCLTALPVYAEDTTSSGGESSPLNTETNVSLTVPVEYTVVVPKTITIEPGTKTGSITITTKDWNTGEGKVNIGIPSSITLGGQSATITGNKKSFAGCAIKQSPTKTDTASYTIDASSIVNAGTYTGNINISFTYDPTPVVCP